METRSISLSKTGLPTMWEKGGAFKNTASATVICDFEGFPKRAIFTNKKGNIACAEHALIRVEVGDAIIEVNSIRNVSTIEILRITDIKKKQLIAKVSRIAYWADGKWDNAIIASKYRDACEAAINKAGDFHCRKPYYVY